MPTGKKGAVWLETQVTPCWNSNYEKLVGLSAKTWTIAAISEAKAQLTLPWRAEQTFGHYKATDSKTKQEYDDVE